MRVVVVSQAPSPSLPSFNPHGVFVAQRGARPHSMIATMCGGAACSLNPGLWRRFRN
jgi:hypothetical protein